MWPLSQSNPGSGPDVGLRSRLEPTGGDGSGRCGSSGVVLDDTDGDLVLLSRSEARLGELVLGGWEGADNLSVFFFLQGNIRNEAACYRGSQGEYC